MKNIIKKVFKPNLDLNFEDIISSDGRNMVMDKINALELFVVKEKTDTFLYKQFFKECDEKGILLSLTMQKYVNEPFVFCNIKIYIYLKVNESIKSKNSFFIDDFKSDLYKEKLLELLKAKSKVQKVSNWSFISLRDMLDVDYIKQTDKADVLFYREDYESSLKIYSRFKSEDDFSFYNMEMEVYCRLITNSKASLNLMYLTNTNFVNTFYHHRLILILLMVNKNDLCFKISRLLYEPFRVYIDLELARRFLEKGVYRRKGLQMLFSSLLYYKDLDFPHEDLNNLFTKNSNDSFLTSVNDYIKKSNSVIVNDIKPVTKENYDNKIDEFIGKSNFYTFIHFDKDETKLFLLNNNIVDLNISDRLLILCTSKGIQNTNFVFENGNEDTDVQSDNVNIEEYLTRQVIVKADDNQNINFAKCETFTLDGFLREIKRKLYEIFVMKRFKFLRKGFFTLNRTSDEKQEIHRTLNINVSSEQNPSHILYVDYDHILFKYQQYNFNISTPHDCKGYFNDNLVENNTIEVMYNKAGVFYEPLKLCYNRKIMYMLIKFSVLTYYSFNFSWSKILSNLITIDINAPISEQTNIKVFVSSTTTPVPNEVYQIVGSLSEHNCSHPLGEKVKDLALVGKSDLNRLKEEVLGIHDIQFEDYYEQSPDVNPPLTTDLSFSEYLNKNEEIIISKKTNRIQFSPFTQANYVIQIQTEKYRFLVPFNIVCKPINPTPFVYIVSSASIRVNKFVKIFLLVNNYVDKDLRLVVNSNVIDIDKRDRIQMCCSTKSSIFEIRCVFREEKRIDKADFYLSLQDKNNIFYKFDIIVDLNL